MKLADLQSAVVARLGGVSAVTDSLGAVPGAYQTHAIYTDVPQAGESEDTAFFPYIVVSLPSAGPFDSKDTNGGNVLVDVRAAYRGHSSDARLSLGDAVYDALHKQEANISVSGANLVNFLIEPGTVEYDDPDGITSHDVRTFRAVYEIT